MEGGNAMSKNILTEEKKCKSCYSPLTEETSPIGICDKCAEKELALLKKRLAYSFAASVALIALVILSSNYMRANVQYTTKDGWDTAVIPFLVWDVNLNANSVRQMLNPSQLSQIITYAICFFFPFTSYVKIELKTYRHQAEVNLWKRGATRDIVNATNTTRTEDAGLFIAEVILSAISGPYLFVRRIYRFLQLSKYVKSING